ncbi:MAG: ThuA domain-containing protein [Planctomycetota bacterium]
MRHRSGWALALVLCLAACPASSAAPQCSVRGGILIECEDCDERRSDDPEFFAIISDLTASDGCAVYRFFKPGRVTYRFSLPEDGTYRFWLRYSAPADVNQKVAIDPQGEPQFESVPLPGTGAVTGEGVWRWMLIATKDLTKGEHTLALGSTPLRPDCVFITPKPDRPDDKMLEEVVRPMGPRLPQLRHEREITQHPKWLHQHLRHCYAHSEWNREITIEDWCKLAAEKGANVINSAGEIPAGMMDGQMKPLPVDAKKLPEGYQVDYSWVKRYADAAHRHGLKYLCYVNSDRTLDPLLIEHPEWRQVGAEGTPRATWGCWNSPYRRAFVDRMVKIAKESGLNGIHIDMPFTAPSGGCRSKYCVELFKAKFGVEPPRKMRPKDPLYQRWVDFQCWTREEWLLDLTEALHQVSPEVAVIVNQTRGWIFRNAEYSFLTTRVAKCVDGLNEEIGWETQHTWHRPWAWPIQQPWQNLFLRCRTWPGIGQMWHVTFNMPEVELQAQAFSSLANGVVPNVTTGGNWDEMSRIWAHIKGCEPWTLGAELVPWAAIHFPEDTIAWHANANGQEALDVWLKNLFGVFQASLETHLPVAVITDDDLASVEALQKYAVVILPNSACLSDEQISALTKYVEGGGGLVATFQSGMFDPFGTERAEPGLQALIGAKQGKADYGVSWTARIADLEHPIVKNEAVARSGSWSQGQTERKPFASLYVGPMERKVGMVQTGQLAEGVQALLPMSGAWRRHKGPLTPEKGYGYHALLARSVGKGKVVYSPLDLGQAYYCYNHPLGRTLIAESVKWAASKPMPMEVDAPMLLQTVLYRKGDAAIIHLVNDVSSFGRAAAPNPEGFTGFRAEVIPLRNIALKLRGSYNKAQLQPSGEELKVEQVDGFTRITIPQLDLHGMVVVE